MDHSSTTLAEDHGPIPSEWTTIPAPPHLRMPRGATPPDSGVSGAADARLGQPRPSESAFPSEWTVADLLDWLSDDARTHDPALRHPLSLVEHALTGMAWAGAPSTVALIRSIAEAVRLSPALRSVRLARLVS